MEPVQEEPNPLMRKKKTPEELAREAEAEDEDEFTSECLGQFSQLKKRCILMWEHNNKENQKIDANLQ